MYSILFITFCKTLLLDLMLPKHFLFSSNTEQVTYRSNYQPRLSQSQLFVIIPESLN